MGARHSVKAVGRTRACAATMQSVFRLLSPLLPTYSAGSSPQGAALGLAADRSLVPRGPPARCTLYRIVCTSFLPIIRALRSLSGARSTVRGPLRAAVLRTGQTPASPPG